MINKHTMGFVFDGVVHGIGFIVSNTLGRAVNKVVDIFDSLRPEKNNWVPCENVEEIDVD